MELIYSDNIILYELTNLDQLKINKMIWYCLLKLIHKYLLKVK